jgi:nucleoside-specific outer membrane channel protein Tsx
MEDPDQRWWGFPQVIMVGQVHQNSSPVLMQRRTICMETGNSTLIFDVFQYAFTLYIIYINAKEVYLHKFKDPNKS